MMLASLGACHASFRRGSGASNAFHAKSRGPQVIFGGLS